jgi:hypothetical protein
MPVYVKNDEVMLLKEGGIWKVQISGRCCCLPLGRCCSPTGCVDNQTEDECADRAIFGCGVHWDVDEECPDDYCKGYCCSAPELGAPDECSETTCKVCLDLNGDWGGFGTTCEEAPCGGSSGSSGSSGPPGSGSSPGDSGGGGDFI